MTHVKNTLIDASMESDDIHDVLLVGGSTKIPRVQEMLSQMFG